MFIGLWLLLHNNFSMASSSNRPSYFSIKSLHTLFMCQKQTCNHSTHGRFLLILHVSAKMLFHWENFLTFSKQSPLLTQSFSFLFSITDTLFIFLLALITTRKDLYVTSFICLPLQIVSRITARTTHSYFIHCVLNNY